VALIGWPVSSAVWPVRRRGLLGSLVVATLGAVILLVIVRVPAARLKGPTVSCESPFWCK